MVADREPKEGDEIENENAALMVFTLAMNMNITGWKMPLLR